jgi:8-oxo-dGTP diphosphatase/2-hydroxy-dATP diphosphatase
VQDNDRVLLGMKKRGFGAGRWNGFGGKVEAGETIENAAKREIQEEAGVTISDIVKTGEIEFEFKGEAQKLEVNIFKAVSYQGEPLETEEMKPQWFKVSEIPFDQMWPDDIYWMPLFLEGKKFKGKFVFEGQSKIVEHKLEIFDA